MRSRIRAIIAAAGLATAGFTGLALAEIEGSKHDFRLRREGEADLCLPCHTAHPATAPAAIPLWNPSADPRQQYVLYGGTRGTLDEHSLMCLSCHDGSTAKDTIGGVKVERGIGKPIVSRGHDLSKDHPIGVPYPRSAKDYKPKERVVADGAIRLPNDTVGCTSCHNAHSPLQDKYMLVKSNARSALCLSCHTK
jgi:predicted CXXCH cytochrome family protein